MPFYSVCTTLKTQLRSISRLWLLSLIITSCELTSTVGPTSIEKMPTFSLDSIRRGSGTTYDVYVSVSFDSTVLLTGFVISYGEEGTQGHSNSFTEIVADTLAFFPYVHKVVLTDLKPNSNYRICGSGHYQLGYVTRTMNVLIWCRPLRTE